MQAISYAHAPISVREDLPASHTRAWQRLARPGYWWTGPERVAIAAEVRQAWHCGLCSERKAALSPYTIDGTHDRVSTLPETARDVVHRLTTDSGRLTKTWYDGVLAAGEISAEQYVEIIDLVVTMVSIDSFCHGIGVPVHPLPDPDAGAPSGYRPAAACVDVAWVPMIPNGQATGEEEGLFGPDGHTANVIRAMSLTPDAVRQLYDLHAAHYLSLEEMGDLSIKKGLERVQMELIAGRVSALRECFY